MAYWYARHKKVDLSIVPVRGCCCIDNRMGTFIAGTTTIVTTLIAILFVIIDIAQIADTNFEISGGFPGSWRMRFWKGFIICDIAMLIAHGLLLGFTICLVGAISWPSRYKLYNLKPVILNFFIVIVLHTLTELGVSTYIYSWYGLAAWIWFMVISYSYILELRQELYTPVDPEARPEIEQASAIPSLLASRHGTATSIQDFSFTKAP
ncbi:unnamed protein product [Rodentolepis nana]|uniref:Transmembrane protein n=1 Tax=Rodentolepis nana TaxID=102285 RepID=A0A0R3TJJ9_RODNA|nr:unnamed protein product [Rodentolepis nana]